jgi:hypothetical protein
MTQGEAEGEVYQVCREYPDLEGGPEWYEYRVWYIVEGKIIAYWDSLQETYNGMQQLNRQEAETALAEILEEVNVQGVDPAVWFDLKEEA